MRKIFSIKKKKRRKKEKKLRSSHLGTAEMNPIRNHEVTGLTLGLIQWVKDLALPRAVR